MVDEIAAVLAANHREFLAFLERRTGSRDAAEEILQSAFVRGIEHAGGVEDAERAVAWFYRVLRNALTDHWRRRAAAQSADDRHRAEIGSPVEDPDLHAEVCKCIGRLLPTLKPEYADILRRVELDGERVQDAASALGLTPNNAGVRVHRARAALRRRVEESCRTCAEHGCLDCDCSGAS